MHIYHPFPCVPQNYIVSHINNLQALVIVQHVQGQFNLYLSDSSGVLYSMSLSDLVQEGGTTFDLQMVCHVVVM